MENIIEWYTGLNDYKKCTLVLGSKPNTFTVELLDVPYNTDKSFSDIFNDHLSIRQTSIVEVLYSGGLDSELTLLHCLKYNIPVIAITMVIRVHGLIINTHDLYYAEKFCREHSITHKLIDLNADMFFENGLYKDYLNPYYITEPHVATHFWLLEQCSHFPILGGDWPWVQSHIAEKVLSPTRLEFASYDRFMKDKGINGIGNMIGYSLDSSLKFMQLHMDNHIAETSDSIIKGKMYQQIEPTVEPRLRSYGWENHKTNKFSMLHYKIDLIKTSSITINTIKWNNSVKNLLNTSITENNKFK